MWLRGGNVGAHMGGMYGVGGREGMARGGKQGVR